jgi:uncharacterized protein DUF1579
LKRNWTLIALAVLFFWTLPAAAQGQANDAHAITEHMQNLKALVGRWTAVAAFHRADGSIRYDLGEYEIGYILDNSYLQWKVVLRDKEDPSKQHSFWIFTTYNPTTGKYDETYIYSGWALRVTETGDFDPATHTFNTTAFIPLEDGKRDEHVRTVIDLSNPRAIVYKHYSHYTGESKDRYLEITLTPAK